MRPLKPELKRWGRLVVLFIGLSGIIIPNELNAMLPHLIGSNSLKDFTVVELWVTLYNNPLFTTFTFIPLSLGLMILSSCFREINSDLFYCYLIRHETTTSYLFEKLMMIVKQSTIYFVALNVVSLLVWGIGGAEFSTELRFSNFFNQINEGSSGVIFVQMGLQMYLGLILIGLLASGLFLVVKRRYIVIFALLGLSLVHSVAFVLGLDWMLSLLPYTQMVYILVTDIEPIVNYYSPIVQVGMLLSYIGLVILMLDQLFKRTTLLISQQGDD